MRISAIYALGVRVKTSFDCHSESTWTCGASNDMKVAVILSDAKDLQFRSDANQCRFFASLRMTDFRESAHGLAARG